MNLLVRDSISLDTTFTNSRTNHLTDISITSHGGFINGFLDAIGRPSYSLPTGGVSHFLHHEGQIDMIVLSGVLPVVVRGTKVPDTHGGPIAPGISEY